MVIKNLVLALDALTENIMVLQKKVNNLGAHLLEEGKYTEAETVINDGKIITEIRSNLRIVKKDLMNMDAINSSFTEKFSDESDENKKTKRKFYSSLEKGSRTKEPEFEIPILKALVKLGGKAPMREVLVLVKEDMTDVLMEMDYQAIPSDSKVIRWENTAQWARQHLVDIGLMEKVAKRGIWEISNAGRVYLSEHNS